MRSAPAAAFMLTLVLCGCARQGADSGAAPASSAAPDTSVAPAPAADKWLGQWNGPEGTFLRLEGGTGKYTITIQNLDGPRTFAGSAVDGRVEFKRDGVTEFIHASDGAATGMKWLVDKTDCLTIRTGEGYCR